ncbi:MAG: hypothetical protein KA271_00565 [Propionivibrio sp.]|nr:hypothetical protein [Propionivibrio sp.]
MSATTRKVPAKIWRDCLRKFDGRVESMCLRRDAYLSKVIGFEVERLDRDIPVPNSKQASKFISEQLDRLDRKSLGFTLDAAVLDRLNEVCASKGIVRDAFFNRLIFWLAASPKVIGKILGADWDSKLWERHKDDIGIYKAGLYPLDESSLATFIDPLWAIHEHYQLQKDLALSTQSFYTDVLKDNMFINTNLWGLNTYLSDIDVPGTPQQKEFDGELEPM